MDWSSLKGVLIDLDGVVYTGREPIPGAAGFLAEARRRGLKFLLVTNNSTTSPELVAERLRTMHVDVQPQEILTSAQAAAAYVRAHAQRGSRVRIIGEAGLRQAAEEEGLSIVDDGGAVSSDWVIAGLDRGFTYEKLTGATRAIMAGARFVATNADALLPVEGGQVLPGAGTMIAAIQTATGVEPADSVLLERFTTQREQAAFAALVQRHGPMVLGVCRRVLHNHHDAEDAFQAVFLTLARKARSIGKGSSVGCWLYHVAYHTAIRARLRTILVLTGVTDRAEADAAIPSPDAIVADLASVADLLGWR